jgi:hypothetical protein
LAGSDEGKDTFKDYCTEFEEKLCVARGDHGVGLDSNFVYGVKNTDEQDPNLDYYSFVLAHDGKFGYGQKTAEELATTPEQLAQAQAAVNQDQGGRPSESGGRPRRSGRRLSGSRGR